MPKITPFLWFEDNAEEAANYYASIFRNSRITATTRYDEEGAAVSGRPKGSVMTVAFQLDGNDFVALIGMKKIDMDALKRAAGGKRAA